jgi:hypothetical protein
MQFDVPVDLEILIRKHIASGRFANPEEVFRRALENLNLQENLTTKTGRSYGAGEESRTLPAVANKHLAGLSL